MPESIDALSTQIDRHQEWLIQAGRRTALLQDRARYRLRRLIERRAAEVVGAFDAASLQAPLHEQLSRALEAIASTTTGDSPCSSTSGVGPA